MKKLASLLLAALLAFALAACAKPAQKAPETDFVGAKLPQLDRVERIVSLTASNTETLFALGLGDKVVGVDAYSDYPEAAQSIDKVGDFNGPNAEAIVALEPDLVLAGNKLQQEAIDQLKALGLTVVATEASAYDEVFDSIALIGAVTGADKQAAELIQSMQGKQAQIEKAVQGKDAPAAYYVLSYGEAGNWTSGPGSFLNAMIEKANGVCVTKDGIDGETATWMQYSAEAIVDQNPQVLIVSSMAGGLEGLREAAGFKDLDAVKNGQVFEVDAAIVERPGPRLVDGLEAVAKALHPDAF